MLLDIYAFHLERAGLIASSKGGLLGRPPLFLKSASEHHNACKAPRAPCVPKPPKREGAKSRECGPNDALGARHATALQLLLRTTYGLAGARISITETTGTHTGTRDGESGE